MLTTIDPTYQNGVRFCSIISEVCQFHKYDIVLDRVTFGLMECVITNEVVHDIERGVTLLPLIPVYKLITHVPAERRERIWLTYFCNLYKTPMLPTPGQQSQLPF